MSETICFVVLTIFFIVCIVCAILDFRLTKSLRIKEDLRRETIKNSLCDISKYLEIVAEHYVLKDIK